uniref:Glycine-rich cell wall structural protein 1.0-like n=1 Tax=Elaeis guineensis var. tenera TaxID=51953 RepID=A0A6I9RYN4_ELAGV|nr:glycine-rich cell wall structural protein 1.0-like [Elaeis guineensis]
MATMETESRRALARLETRLVASRLEVVMQTLGQPVERVWPEVAKTSPSSCVEEVVDDGGRADEGLVHLYGSAVGVGKDISDVLMLEGFDEDVHNIAGLIGEVVERGGGGSGGGGGGGERRPRLGEGEARGVGGTGVRGGEGRRFGGVGAGRGDGRGFDSRMEPVAV